MNQIEGELVPIKKTQAPGPVRLRGRPKGNKNKLRETEESV